MPSVGAYILDKYYTLRDRRLREIRESWFRRERQETYIYIGHQSASLGTIASVWILNFGGLQTAAVSD